MTTTALNEPDQTLLSRWTTRRDADAFRELAVRHAGMVYNTCRRITRDTHRAEDLTQECFLRLARLDSARPGERLGAWLHRVATRVSLDALRSEKRRAARDKAFAEGTVSTATDPWNTIEPFIDEAIAQLPEELRAPLVAHFLNGRTHQSIAEELGLTRRTVTNHIQRAIEEVRATLGRKHVAIGASALAIGLTERASATVPSSLYASLGKMALVGKTSAAVTPFVMQWLGSYPLMVAAAALVATVAYVGVIAIPGALTETQAQVESPIPIVTEEEPAVEDAPVIADAPASSRATRTPIQVAANASSPTTVAATAAEDTYPFTARFEGKVLDQRGEPIAGARVYALPRNATYREHHQAGFTAYAQANGAYFLHVRSHDAHFVITAQAEGRRYGGEVIQLEPGESRVATDFILDEGVTLAGRILTESGSPAVGALVLHRGFYGDVSRGNGNYENIAIADNDGRFILGYPEEGEAVLCVMLPDAGQTPFMMVPVSGEPVVLQPPAPAQVIGRVSEADGSPAADYAVQLVGTFVNTGSACQYQTTTDGNGLFSFDDVIPPGAGDDLTYVLRMQREDAMGGALWVAAETLGALIPGERRAVDIELPSARVLRGIVTGDVTGRPLQQVRIHLAQDGETIAEGTTDRRGRYEFAVPSSGVFVAFPQQVGYVESDYEDAFGERVEFTRAETKTQDFVIPESVTVSLRVVDTDGSPVKAAVDHVSATMEHGLSTWGTSETGPDGRYVCDFITPGIETHLRVHGPGYASARSTTWTGEAGQLLPEETITLYPSAGAKGVLVDDTGAVWANAEFNLIVGYNDTHGDGERAIKVRSITDQDGKFSIARGLPATRVQLSAETFNGDMSNSGAKTTLLEGTVRDVGTIIVPSPIQ